MKKTNALQNFRVLSGAHDAPKEFIALCKAFLQSSRWTREPVSKWLQQNKSFRLFRAESAFRKSPLVAPVLLFDWPKTQRLPNSIWKIDNNKTIKSLQAAIDQKSPARWQYGNLLTRGTSDKAIILFGTNLWLMTKTDLERDAEEQRLLLLEEIDKDRKYMERLRVKYSGVAGETVLPARAPISEDVRIFVWRRDSAQCTKCGSQEKLEYDHIIPVIKGGSATARNIQLLCERCNREKSDRI
jgi:hypothetical protein